MSGYMDVINSCARVQEQDVFSIAFKNMCNGTITEDQQQAVINYCESHNRPLPMWMKIDHNPIDTNEMIEADKPLARII